MDEWFSRRKGFAFGVMWAGTGLAGIILPIIMERGLAQYGFRTMVRSYAVALFILAGPLLYYVKPRIPPAMASHSRRVDLGFLKSPTFLVFQTGNIIEGLGYFMPSIYLPTYARSLGLSQFSGTLTVVLFNTTSVVGCLLMGAMTDKYHVTTCIIASTVGTMLSVFLFWGLSLSMAFLTIFALTYGLFAGCYTSTFPGILREIQTRDPRAPTGMVFAMLAAGRGVGSVVSGPLSEVLIRGSSAKVDSFYSENFRGLIIFTGVTAALGGFSWAGKRVGWI
ncbi:MAG: hypothetical protein M1814_000828 [Vezdaea aestivalis]|nr:MAG: hypothetical protein M1814_000828 [Vezdaea aestivalis]